MRIGTALAGLLLAGACLANQVQESKVDAQTRELARELRCTVCQSETLWESNSTLAQQMRALIREKLQQGQSPQQVKDFLFQRYGDYILMKPRFSGAHIALWLLPLVLLLAGGFALWRTLLRWKQPDAAPMSPGADSLPAEMRARIDKELQQAEDES
ncbi:MAG: cytochrome c-type biogenesis protein [Chitinivorax sp.]|jgi:cytochrome c-type biogenesis protein CcmH